jgi:flagellum-specific peptidoglycan hydrolase FlgJ
MSTIWSFIFLVFMLSGGHALNGDHAALTRQYIETYKYLAIDEMHRTGIPASITLAQAIVESNAGTSPLAVEANNHFGIKCKHYWKGETYYQKDDDRDQEGRLIDSCFRKYDDIEASYIDHSNFLVYTLHYRPLFDHDRRDYSSWARGLKECGYATDRRYADKIIQTIKKYGLDELDYYVVRYE